VISRLLHSSLRAFKIARYCFPLNHLYFVDDLVIFTHATSREATITNDCLDKYSSWFGQMVNINKSFILFSKNTSSTITAIQNIIPYTITPTIAKHLSFPIMFGKSKTVVFSDILKKKKNQGKIKGSRSKTLSQAGKSVLIKVVVSSIPSHAMSFVILPEGLCNQMDKAFKIFWWGLRKDKVHNLSLKSWKSMCTPKDQRGLGFRLMKDVNLSLISKLGWKLLSNQDSLWVSQLQTKYIKYSNLLSSSLKPSSWVWNGIKVNIHLLSVGACFIPNIHYVLPIWSSPWIPTIPHFLPTPRISSIPSNYSLVIANVIHSYTYSWNQSLLNFLFDLVIVFEILKITISPNPSNLFLWTPFTFGSFSTKSVHHLICSFSPSRPSPLSSISWKAL
jgi:hypothetical protein